MRSVGVVLVVLVASLAHAQPFPGAVLVNGGWVPCTHPTAIAAGRGCGTAPRPVAAATTAPLEVGRFYRNLENACEVKVIAIGVTWQHQRPMSVAEVIKGRETGACPEVVLWFDPARPPDGNWIDITDEIPVEWRTGVERR